MLNMIVRIKQTRTDCPDVRLQRLAYHLVQPIRIDDRQVVIQQGDKFRLDLPRREIIEPTEIEFLFPAQHPNPRFARDGVEEGQRRWLLRAIINQNDFEIRIRRLPEETLDARLEQRDQVARWDDDRDVWL